MREMMCGDGNEKKLLGGIDFGKFQDRLEIFDKI